MLGACQEALATWIVAQATENAAPPNSVFTSALTGKITSETEVLVEQKAYLAHFHVVQARAGRCGVP